MINPLVSVVRFFAVLRNRSKVEHGLLPLSEVKSVAVFCSGEQEDCIEAVKKFFGQRGVALSLYYSKKGNLNCWGFIKKKLRAAKSRNEELFICLSDIDTCFAARYESLCSRAKFKIGRNKCEKDIFDLTVLAPAELEVREKDLFLSIVDLLNKIK